MHISTFGRYQTYIVEKQYFICHSCNWLCYTFQHLIKDPVCIESTAAQNSCNNLLIKSVAWNMPKCNQLTKSIRVLRVLHEFKDVDDFALTRSFKIL